MEGSLCSAGYRFDEKFGMYIEKLTDEFLVGVLEI